MNADLALTATVSTRAGLECVLTELQNAQRWMCEGMQESTALIKIRQTHLCVLLFLWFEASHSEMWQQSWWSWQHFTTWVHNQKLREQQCCKKTVRQAGSSLPSSCACISYYAAIAPSTVCFLISSLIERTGERTNFCFLLLSNERQRGAGWQ